MRLAVGLAAVSRKSWSARFPFWALALQQPAPRDITAAALYSIFRVAPAFLARSYCLLQQTSSDAAIPRTTECSFSWGHRLRGQALAQSGDLALAAPRADGGWAPTSASPSWRQGQIRPGADSAHVCSRSRPVPRTGNRQDRLQTSFLAQGVGKSGTQTPYSTPCGVQVPPPVQG